MNNDLLIGSINTFKPNGSTHSCPVEQSIYVSKIVGSYFFIQILIEHSVSIQWRHCVCTVAYVPLKGTRFIWVRITQTKTINCTNKQRQQTICRRHCNKNTERLLIAMVKRSYVIINWHTM